MDNVPIAEKKKRNKERIKPVADVVSVNTIVDLADNIKIREYRCLYYVLYLTGCRISEALELRVNDIEYKPIIEESKLDGKQIIRKVAIFDLVTNKRKDKPKRKIPVVYYDSRSEDLFKVERMMIEFIKAFAEDNKLPQEKVFRVKRTTASEHFRKHMEITTEVLWKGKRLKNYTYKIHPHYLRHCRLTHLREAGFDALDLKQFAGWTSISMTNIYLHAGYKPLMEKMIKNG